MCKFEDNEFFVSVVETNLKFEFDGFQTNAIESYQTIFEGFCCIDRLKSIITIYGAEYYECNVLHSSSPYVDPFNGDESTYTVKIQQEKNIALGWDIFEELMEELKIRRF